jgi:hypothetical protein
MFPQPGKRAFCYVRRKMEEMELKADTVRQVTSYSNHLSVLINFPTVIKN